MEEKLLKKARKLSGCITVPGDKSISHRAALLSLLCKEPVEVLNFAPGEDCRHSLEAVKILGGRIEKDGDILRLIPPAGELAIPTEPIDCGNSATTIRLLAGLLAGSNMTAELTGDESLRRRPMKRLVEPLKKMNAAIEASEEGTAPLKIAPAGLIPIDYILPVSSAQVKSALLLAGLASGCEVVVREKSFTRNHTEKMIRHLGGNLIVEDVKTEIVPNPDDPRKKQKKLITDKYKRSIIYTPGEPLMGGRVEIPGDISTAAFFIAAALMVRGSHLIIQKVGVNSTRTGFINLLKLMGAEINVKNRKEISGEAVADIDVKYSVLKPRKIAGDAVAGLIDELPILAVLAAQIEGTTVIRDAEELRHKECDRIRALAENLMAMGIKVGEFPDGLAIEGGELSGAELDSFGDHRIAMSFAVAGLAAHGKTVIKGSETVGISCPQFFEMLEGLRS